MRVPDNGFVLDIIYHRQVRFTREEWEKAYPVEPLGEPLYCEATLTDGAGWPILRTYGLTVQRALLDMELLLEKQELTGAVEFIGKLLDECRPRRSLHHGECSGE